MLGNDLFMLIRDNWKIVDKNKFDKWIISKVGILNMELIEIGLDNFVNQIFF